MRCLACDCNLSDKEANRKFLNYTEIKNPEDRYIGLCDPCLKDSEIEAIEENILNDEEIPDDD